MNLTVIKGLAEAKRALVRAGPIDVEGLSPEVMERTASVFGERLSAEESVQRILRDVRQHGDSAVIHYSRAMDDVDIEELEVPDQDIAQACQRVPEGLMKALELAARRIEDFHKATMRRGWVDLSAGLGELVLPLERVGIYAPGGTAPYPSTVLMTAIPARVAGVEEIVLATPPRAHGHSGDGPNPDPALLAAASLAGVNRVFRVGGVQAIGAMAFGTETIPKVDKICGPGNVFVTLAKRSVFGQVDIDGLYGPTETVIIADETANPVYCASDLLAQAEHDPLATPILITTSLSLVAEVEAALDSQLGSLERGELAGVSVERRGKLILVDSIDQALELANGFAPEHLCMMVRDPWAWAGHVRHAGGLFLGPFSPEVMGDYVAGPSHVMPTGGTARFSSALSVHQFLKTMPVIGLKPEEYGGLAEAAAVIARAEGLTGHAMAVEVRLRDLENLGNVDRHGGDKGSNRGGGSP